MTSTNVNGVTTTHQNECFEIHARMIRDAFYFFEPENRNKYANVLSILFTLLHTRKDGVTTPVGLEELILYIPFSRNEVQDILLELVRRGYVAIVEGEEGENRYTMPMWRFPDNDDIPFFAD
jgi:hypothetical protein